VVSVDDHMDFGIVANAAVVADAFELARACEAAFAQLTRAVKRSRATPDAQRSQRRKRVSP
jgi:hypothetical protein